MSDSVESIQLAPAGIVTDIYPAEGNETGKIDLIHDKDRGEIHSLGTAKPLEEYLQDYEIKKATFGLP